MAPSSQISLDKISSQRVRSQWRSPEKGNDNPAKGADHAISYNDRVPQVSEECSSRIVTVVPVSIAKHPL